MTQTGMADLDQIVEETYVASQRSGAEAVRRFGWMWNRGTEIEDESESRPSNHLWVLSALYRPAYALTAIAHSGVAMLWMISGAVVSAFQASQHAVTMAS